MNRGKRSHWLLGTVVLHTLLSTGCGARTLLVERRPVAQTDAGQSRDAATLDIELPGQRDAPNPFASRGEPCDANRRCSPELFCPEDQNVVRVCADECRSDADCGMRGHCVLDRRFGAPIHGVCSEVLPGQFAGGMPCTMHFECRSNACILGQCRALCQQDTECSRAQRCLPMMQLRGLTTCQEMGVNQTVTEEQTLFTGRIPQGMQHSGEFMLPADATSLSVTVQDTTGRDLLASLDVLRVNNVELINLAAFDPVVEPLVRYLPVPEISTALVPSNNTLRIQPGRYQYSVTLRSDPPGMEDGTHEVSVILRTKRSPMGTPASGVLTVRLIFAPGLSLNATTARTSIRMRDALAGMRRAYGNMGIRVDVLETVDLTVPNAALFSIIDSIDELNQLFASAPGPRRDVIDLFFVAGLSMDAFDGAIGIAGGIVGPPGIHGTGHSGVVIDLENTMPMNGNEDTLPLVMTHEAGHYLGLWHTQERLDPCMDAMQMDCSLWGGFDAISDTPNNAQAAVLNVMYWAATPGEERFSPGQGLVIRGNPVITH